MRPRVLCTKSISILFAMVLLLAANQFPATAETIVDHDITEDTTWAPAGSPYIITPSSTDVTIRNGATLTIQPSVEVRFDYGKRLKVGNPSDLTTGTLVAIGAPGNNIVFTADTDIPYRGYWYSIWFTEYAVSSQMAYCQVRYGGMGNLGNIRIEYSAPTISNSKIGWSSSYGIYLNASSANITSNLIYDNLNYGLYAFNNSNPVVSGNSFVGNGSWAAYITSNGLGSYSGNTGSGNLVNGLVLNGTVSANDSNWGATTDFPYVIYGSVTVNDGVTLTLKPGVVVKFYNSSSYLVVRGTLIAGGGPGSEIVFTSIYDDEYGGPTALSENSAKASGPARGDWYYIEFDGNGAYDGYGVIDNCIVRYGGNGNNGNIWCSNAGENNMPVQITNSTIAHSSSEGIYAANSFVDVEGNAIDNNRERGLDANEGIVTVNDNVFTDNGDWAAYITGSNLGSYSGNSGSGNGINGLVLNGTVSTNGNSWGATTDFPYVIYGAVTVNDDIALTLEPGVVVKSYYRSGNIVVYGTLVADGEPGSKIVFTSIYDDEYGGPTALSSNPAKASGPAKGDWYYIEFYGNSTNDGQGVMDNCIVRYGGYGGNGNIWCSSAGEVGTPVQITNSVISNSLSEGIYATSSFVNVEGNVIDNNRERGLNASGGIVTVNDNVFTDNGDWAAYITSNSLGSYRGNSGNGNALDGLVLEGQMSGNRVWGETHNFPYVIRNLVQVNDDATLTLEPGVVIKFFHRSDSGGYMNVYGTLRADGAPEKPTVFTSIRDDEFGGDTDNLALSPDRGDWHYITFEGSGAYEGIGLLDNCIIRYGGWNGSYGSIRGNVSDELIITDCVITNSLTHGIYTINTPAVVMNNTIEHNGSYGLLCNASVPDILYNIFTDNDVGLYCTGSTTPGVHFNSFSGNRSYGVQNVTSSVTVNATNNWWGATDGPSGEGTGSGDAVSLYVSFNPWITSFPTVTLIPNKAVYGPGDRITLDAHITNTGDPLPSTTVHVEVEPPSGPPIVLLNWSGTLPSPMDIIKRLLDRMLPGVAPGTYVFRGWIDSGPLRYDETEVPITIEGTTGAAPLTQGLQVKEQLLAPALRKKPQTFCLLQNFSNPFNPDTWIPYQLAENVDVTIRIYDVAGKTIRTLNLGYRPAGFYTDRAKAAHWDGRNEAGESVASGIYFYSITAGDFTATRKMTVAR